MGPSTPGLPRSAHVILHRRPADAVPGERIALDGCQLATLALSSHQQSEPFAISFETATARLGELPRMFVEPDGSFVWVSAGDDETAWQMDGVVSDRADHVVSVELKGTCPRRQWEELLRVFAEPDVRLVVQLVQAAVFLEVVDFFRWAEQGR